jgi:putative protease
MVAPELLLPAGDPEKLRYAVAYGADAVYLGLPMASLRTPSRGGAFTADNLGQWIAYAQQRGVKAYVTLNIFANNRDLDRLGLHLTQLAHLPAPPDALIISDPGVFRLAKRLAPDIPIHLSTQANTLNIEACAFWEALGVQRIILAREVPLREMAEIHAALPNLQLECFVHGSLCIAYSGRCVISDYLTDNTHNANKGMCGNACRWEYTLDSPPPSEAQPQPPTQSPWQDNSLPSLAIHEATRPHDPLTLEEDAHGTYLLNSKDLCLVRHLPALQAAGICSFKVEGRTKSVFYVATVGRVYRQAIDYIHQQQTSPVVVPEALLDTWASGLRQAGNRGFTEGFLYGRPNQGAYQFDTPDTQQSATFVATSQPDMSAPPGFVAVRARNPFSVGDVLQWMLPTGIMAQAPVSDALTLAKTGQRTRSLQTNQVGFLALPPGVAPLPPAPASWLLLSRLEGGLVAERPHLTTV